MATPLLGSLLLRTAGIEGHTLSTLLVVGLGSFLALAAGAAAYNYRRDPLLFACVTVFTGALLFVTPFMGYSDNVLALLLVTGALAVIPAGRRGALAVGLCVFLVYLAHPPVATGFVAAVLSVVAVRFAVKRSWSEMAKTDGPLVIAVVAAAAAGVSAWYLGAWGATARFGDGIDPSNLSKDEFVDRLLNWLGQLEPWITVPLILVAIVALVVERRRLADGRGSAVMVLWILPVFGALGFLTDSVFPYHRFLNVTAAHLLLGGIGLWVVTTFLSRLVRPRGVKVAASLLGLAIAAAVLFPLWSSGLRRWNAQGGGWLGYLRPPTAAVVAYFRNVSDPPPVVFIAADTRTRPWNFRRGTAHRLRAALPAPLVQRAYVFVGNVRDFLAGRATGSPRLARVSKATFLDASRALGSRRPLVLLMRQWNETPANRRYLRRPHAVPMERDLFVLRGPGLVEPDERSLQAAHEAGARERAHITSQAGISIGDPAHLARVIGSILLVALVPGMLLVRWFGRTDPAYVLGVAAPLSLAMNLGVGFVLLAVLRRPVTSGMAWTIVAIATALGSAGWFAARRRPPPATVTADVTDRAAEETLTP